MVILGPRSTAAPTSLKVTTIRIIQRHYSAQRISKTRRRPSSQMKRFFPVPEVVTLDTMIHKQVDLQLLEKIRMLSVTKMAVTSRTFPCKKTLTSPAFSATRLRRVTPP